MKLRGYGTSAMAPFFTILKNHYTLYMELFTTPYTTEGKAKRVIDLRK